MACGTSSEMNRITLRALLSNGQRINILNWTRGSESRLRTRSFRRVTSWTPKDLAGRRVLDAGCGAGRYSEIAFAWGAHLTSLDRSGAAYTTRENLPDRNVTVIRGDLSSPPLRSGWFEKIFCIGVLQHTPDPLATARQLVSLLCPGGQIVIWMYERHWYTRLMPKAILRRVTRHSSPQSIERLVRILVRLWTPAARVTAMLPAGRLRHAAHSILPIASYWGELPLDSEEQLQWSLLDTSDWLTPVYDLPQTFPDIRRALVDAGAVHVRRLEAPGLAITAWKGPRGE